MELISTTLTPSLMAPPRGRNRLATNVSLPLPPLKFNRKQLLLQVRLRLSDIFLRLCESELDRSRFLAPVHLTEKSSAKYHCTKKKAWKSSFLSSFSIVNHVQKHSFLFHGNRCRNSFWHSTSLRASLRYTWPHSTL